MINFDCQTGWMRKTPIGNDRAVVYELIRL